MHITKYFAKNKFMNQILVTNLNNKKTIKRKYKNLTHHKKKKKNKHIWAYFSFLVICVMGITLSFSIYINEYRNRVMNEKISQSLSETYNISTLYSKNNSYSVSSVNNDSQSLVTGIIKIDRIKISYPILSVINDEYLKISPCRFYGPYPNEVGNLCIAAHNYDDNRFFSKIEKLKTGDVITIYDNRGSYKYYKIYKVFETNIDDISCTNQDTNGKREVTLVTCNNINGNRIIVKAREME